MKLNAYIIQERLHRKYPIKMYGKASRDMVLNSPELYRDNTHRFYTNHVYLATVEHLPPRPVIEKNVVLVCIGENARLSYYKEHATVILIKKKADFFEVFQILQSIYEQFYNWESQLLALFMKAPTIQDVLDCTYPIFERSIFVLDTSFQYAASVHPSGKGYKSIRWNLAQGNLDSEAFLAFLREKELSMEKHGAFLLEFEEGNVLCVNLFNANAEYIGCLCIDQRDAPYIEGEDMLAEYLADMIEKITETTPVLLQNERSSLSEILQNIMNEMPLSQNQKLFLHSSNYKQNYMCVSIHYLKRFSALPVSYICSVLEALFPASIFFEHNNTILGLIPLIDVSEEAKLKDELKTKMTSLIEEMQLCVGVSNDFADLYMLRIYYFQAESAIENGQLFEPSQKLHLFSDFALSEMIINSLGGFPVQTYFPNGFRRLQEHDQHGGISYLETLSVYLEENMSYARAARRLYIHRSTLIERISRIENELSVDFSDPDQRLKVQIILKALHIEKQMKDQ